MAQLPLAFVAAIYSAETKLQTLQFKVSADHFMNLPSPMPDPVQKLLQ